MRPLFRHLLLHKHSTDLVFYIGIALALIPFFLISAYNYPAGHDDINNAVEVMNRGAWGAFTYFYHAWTGRYTLIWLCSWFNPLMFKSWLLGVRVAPLIHFGLFILAAAYFIRSVFYTISYLKAFLLACLFLAIFLFAIPAVADLFYWVTAAFTYTYGLIFFLISAGSTVNYVRTENSGTRILHLICAACFAIAAIGTNESCLLAVLLFNCFIVAVAFWQNSPNKYGLLFLLICALICSIFSATAPGNAMRSGAIRDPSIVFNARTLTSALVHSIYYSTLNIVSWANSLVLILVSVLFIPIGLKLLEINSWLRKAAKIHPVISLTATLLFLSAQTFPSFLCKNFVDDRVWSSIYFFFLLAWFFNLIILISIFQKYLSGFDFKKLAFLKVGLVFLLLLSGGGNVSRAYSDLILRAPAYSASLRERYKVIDASKNKDLVVPPIFNLTHQYPLTIYSTDISTETDNYRNTSVSEYFGLKSIRLKNEPTKYP